MFGRFFARLIEKAGNTHPKRHRRARARAAAPRGRLECLEPRQLLSVWMESDDQLLWYLVNRARSDPAAEAARYNMDLNQGLTPGTISPEPRLPLAPHQSLVTAAGAHAQDMLNRDFFDHVNPDQQAPADRAQAAGYPSSAVGENIAWGGTTGTLDHNTAVYERHEDLFRSTEGHRENMLRTTYRELGTGVRFGNFTETGVTYDSCMVDETFGFRSVGPVLTGVVYYDANGNRSYDLNEGLGGVTITVGAQSTTTNAAGGWDLEVTPDVYDVTASGGAFAGAAHARVAAHQATNIEIDFLSGQAQGVVNFGTMDATPPEARLDAANVEAGGGPDYTFTVTYTDDVAVDASTLDNLDLRVIDPQGRTLLATLVTVDSATNGTPRTATYRMGAPGGTWDPGDNGIYMVYLQPNQVTDASGNEVRSGVIGTFIAQIPELLGTISFQALTGLDPSVRELWYRGQAIRDGLLTLEAAVSGSPDGATLSLYNLNYSRLATSTLVAGRPRIDWTTAAGQTYLIKLSGSSTQVDLRLANLVRLSPDGTQMTVYDSPGDDTLVASLSSPLTLLIDGIRYQSAAATSLLARGGAGGADVTKLYDSPGNDSLVASPGYARLEGAGKSLVVQQFGALHVYATAGGFDTAKLYDSPGSDTFSASPADASLFGPGFYNRAKGFEAVHAYASIGNDAAQLYDSLGNDTFYASPTEASLYGLGFYNRAKGFKSVSGFSTAGGSDTANLYDSAGDDSFGAAPTGATFSGAGFSSQAVGFENVNAYAGVGQDVAMLYDSPGNDNFVAGPGGGTLSGPGYANRASGFDGVHAYSTAGGFDVAKFYDSPGDDTFYASPTEASLYGAGFYNRAKFFDAVHAFATAGGRDVANLVDSAASDNFYASPIEASLYGEGFYNRAKFFEEVRASATAGGYDRAELHDSALVDLLEAEGNWARLSNAAMVFFNEVTAFDYVKATATTPGDKRGVNPASLSFVLEAAGPWEEL